jgi:hypothetical protein
MTAAVTHTNHSATNNKSGMDAANTAATATIASQDVGLLFVREYYTFLNKKPLRLHAFYNKDSYFVRGDEGETVQTYHGQEVSPPPPALKTHNEEQVLTGCFWSFQLIGNPSKD